MGWSLAFHVGIRSDILFATSAQHAVLGLHMISAQPLAKHTDL